MKKSTSEHDQKTTLNMDETWLQSEYQIRRIRMPVLSTWFLIRRSSRSWRRSGRQRCAADRSRSVEPRPLRLHELATSRYVNHKTIFLVDQTLDVFDISRTNASNFREIAASVLFIQHFLENYSKTISVQIRWTFVTIGGISMTFIQFYDFLIERRILAEMLVWSAAKRTYRKSDGSRQER